MHISGESRALVFLASCFLNRASTVLLLLLLLLPTAPTAPTTPTTPTTPITPAPVTASATATATSTTSYNTAIETMFFSDCLYFSLWPGGLSGPALIAGVQSAMARSVAQHEQHDDDICRRRWS